MLAEDSGCLGWIVTYGTSFLKRPQQPGLPERRADLRVGMEGSRGLAVC